MPCVCARFRCGQVSIDASLRNPALYVRGQWNLDLNLRTFALWIGNAFVHALIVFFLPLNMLDQVRPCAVARLGEVRVLLCSSPWATAVVPSSPRPPPPASLLL